MHTKNVIITKHSHMIPHHEIEIKTAGTWQTLQGCHGNKL